MRNIPIPLTILFSLFIACESDAISHDDKDDLTVVEIDSTIIIYESQLDIIAAYLKIEGIITLSSSTTADYNPVTSPIDDGIVYSSSTNNNTELILVNSNGTESSTLVSSGVSDYEFSPDGEEIIFTQDKQIKTININNNIISDVTSDQNSYYEPSYSPDMTEIVYVGKVNNVYHIGKMNANGSNQKVLVDSIIHVSSPAYSPSGDNIMFLSQDGLFIMKTDGSELTNLTNHYEADWAPVFTPDGLSILYETNIDGNKEIYSIGTDASNNTNLTNNPANDITPSLNADGTQLLYVSDRDGDKEIFIMNIDGTAQTQVTENTVDDNTPHFVN